MRDKSKLKIKVREKKLHFKNKHSIYQIMEFRLNRIINYFNKDEP